MTASAKQFDSKYFSSGSYDGYEKDIRNWNKFAARKILNIARDIENPTIFDVGCAQGYLLAEFQNRYGLKVKGLEFSPHALKNADKTVKKHIKQGNLLKEKGKKNSYDIIICFDVFEYLNEEDNKRAAKKLVDWSKKYIFFSNPYKHSIHNSQKHNPDNLRITAFTQKEYIKLFSGASARFIKKFNVADGGELLVFKKK